MISKLYLSHWCRHNLFEFEKVSSHRLFPECKSCYFNHVSSWRKFWIQSSLAVVHKTVRKKERRREIDKHREEKLPKEGLIKRTTNTRSASVCRKEQFINTKKGKKAVAQLVEWLFGNLRGLKFKSPLRSSTCIISENIFLPIRRYCTEKMI